MWPIEADEFESLVVPPETIDKDKAHYFLVMTDAGNQIGCISKNGVPTPIGVDEFRWLDVDIHSQHFLGMYRDHACYAVEATGKLPPGYSVAGLRDWLGRAESSLFYVAGRAVQVVDWHLSNRFCGRCGTQMNDHKAERAKVCGDCRLVSYPRLSPSIIVLLRKDDKMLLARNAAWPTSMYSTLAGFVEPGESIEQTVHREVMEEVGLTVKNIRYLGSQSWPFPNSLMLGFHADYAGGNIVYQDGEIADAQWFGLNDLPNMPPGTAISRWLIDDFINELGE